MAMAICSRSRCVHLNQPAPNPNDIFPPEQLQPRAPFPKPTPNHDLSEAKGHGVTVIGSSTYLQQSSVIEFFAENGYSHYRLLVQYTFKKEAIYTVSFIQFITLWPSSFPYVFT
jgi:hypothetical protein